MGINYRWQPYRAGLFGLLPEDLKRDILEIIAYQYPLLAPKLTLVSKDVQRWIEHIIYREIIFTCHRFDSSDPEGDPLSRFKRTIAVRPASFFAEHVKTLHFEGNSFTVDSIMPLLNVCTGVTNFGCYATFTTRRDNQYGAVQDDDDDETSAEKLGPTKVYEYIQSLALERLFISQENLTELLKTPNPAPAPNGDPLGILRATHLCITNGWRVPFSRFPRLTHWALMPENEACVPKVKRVLGRLQPEEGAENQAEDQFHTQQIQSVVVILNDIRGRTTSAAKALREVIDPRLVQFTLPVSSKKFIEDDLWDLAMEFPDEDLPVTYLDWEPSPRIYTFQEAKDLGLFSDDPKPGAERAAPAQESMEVDKTAVDRICI